MPYRSEAAGTPDEHRRAALSLVEQALAELAAHADADELPVSRRPLDRFIERAEEQVALTSGAAILVRAFPYLLALGRHAEVDALETFVASPSVERIPRLYAYLARLEDELAEAVRWSAKRLSRTP